MFETLKIKRLQKEILKRGRYEVQIQKSIEELDELTAEIFDFKRKCQPYIISDSDLKKNVGNMQKEIADVENIICKLKLMFVRTSAQRKAYKQGKRDIVYALEEYLRRGM